MHQKKHDPESLGSKPRDHAHPRRHYWKRAHRDWRLWLAVLMIAMILVYVMTDSLAFGPGNSGVEPMPAMNAP